MARWVDASDEQKFWQYTLPAARRRVAAQEWQLCMKQAEEDAAATKARMEALEEGTLAYNSARRHLEMLRGDWSRARQSLRFDLGIIAEADRRTRSGFGRSRVAS